MDPSRSIPRETGGTSVALRKIRILWTQNPQKDLEFANCRFGGTCNSIESFLVQGFMQSSKPNAALFNGGGEQFYKVWPSDRLQAIAERCELDPTLINPTNFDRHLDRLSEVEVGFSTWGMPKFTTEQVARMPKLKAVFYAAGSVQAFARPLLAADVKVFSAWVANGIPVAEFTLSQILLSCKGYFRNIHEIHSNPQANIRKTAPSGPGIYNATVALIGFGVIARKLSELLRNFSVNVLVVDPFVDDNTLREYGVTRATLEEAFADALVVSNHLPNIPPTVGMLEGKHFRSMRDGASFINTGRGQQIREDEMIAVLRDRPDLTALLDVTFPEPSPPESPLYTLPNVRISSHIAGSINNEVVRMADFMLEEYDRWIAGRPTRYEVTLEMLEAMA
jgi:phosphoglycerate dehydrogenase-like enzyme